MGIVLLRVRKERGWRMTRGGQAKKKEERHNNEMARDQTQ